MSWPDLHVMLQVIQNTTACRDPLKNPFGTPDVSTYTHVARNPIHHVVKQSGAFAAAFVATVKPSIGSDPTTKTVAWLGAVGLIQILMHGLTGPRRHKQWLEVYSCGLPLAAPSHITNTKQHFKGTTLLQIRKWNIFNLTPNLRLDIFLSTLGIPSRPLILVVHSFPNYVVYFLDTNRATEHGKPIQIHIWRDFCFMS